MIEERLLREFAERLNGDVRARFDELDDSVRLP
jgi:hypothetical protein